MSVKVASQHQICLKQMQLISKYICLFVCFVALRPKSTAMVVVGRQQLWSLRDGQFTLPHFFLGRLEQAVNQ